MASARVNRLFDEDRQHLPVGDETHFHIVITSSEDDWEFPRILTSPPYRDRIHAEQDVSDPGFVAKFSVYDVRVLECRRVCPHSSLGRFGWPDEQPVPYRWWAPGGSRS
jgi:hypothetical protein